MKLPTRLALGLLALLSSCPAAGQEREGARTSSVLVAHVDPAILAPRLVLPAPIILGATLGIPRVIAWAGTSPAAGIAWGSTASITAGNAYVSYNGTNMLLNVPTGDGFSFLVNNVEVFGVPTGGGIKTNVIQIASGTTLTIKDAAGNDGVVYTDEGTTMSVVFSDNITAEGGTFNENVALLSSLALSGTITDPAFPDLGFESDSDGWKFDGNVVILGVADIIQLRIKANIAAQTANLFVIEDASGTDLFAVTAAGVLETNVIQIISGTTLILKDAGGNTGVTCTDSASKFNCAFDGDISINSGYGLYFSTGAVSSGLTQLSIGGGTATGQTMLIDGSTDVPQLVVQGHSTQTTLPFIVENSAGTDVATISNTGALVVSSCTGCGAGIGGSTGATDNAILRADGTGGSTLQNSVLTMGDTGAATLTIGGTAPGIVFTNVNAGNEFDCNGACGFADPIGVTGAVQTTSDLQGIPGGATGNYRTAPLMIGAVSTAVGNVGTGEDDLIVIALPASSLVTGNDSVIQYHAFGTIANTANAKTLKIYFGTQVMLTHAMTVSIAASWVVDCRVSRTGSNTQDWYCEYRGNTGAANVFDWEIENGTATQTQTSSLNFKGTGQATADNDIVMEQADLLYTENP